MAGRHEAAPSTFDATVSEYVTGRARELIRQFDSWQAQVITLPAQDWDDAARQRMFAINEWTGAAAEILRELTRDA